MATCQRDFGIAVIYADQYQDIDHLRNNIKEFIERYYNQKRLHSAIISARNDIHWLEQKQLPWSDLIRKTLDHLPQLSYPASVSRPCATVVHGI